MTAGRFDTLAAVRDLEGAGIDPRRAEAIVSVQWRANEDLATKADLGELRADFRACLAALENRMLKAAYALAFGVVLTNVTLTVALVKLL